MTKNRELTVQDKKLLNLVQSDFPLVEQPFEALGQKLGLSEEQALQQVRNLKEERIIRHIGAIFDSRRLGYLSVLIAMHIAPDQLETQARAISRNSWVSHSYAREHHYNLWLTLSLHPDQDLDEISESLQANPGVGGMIILPALRMFKIDARFDMIGDDIEPLTENQGVKHIAEIKADRLSGLEIAIVQELQKDLSLTEKPFSAMSERLKIDATELLRTAKDFLTNGTMRRYGAVLNHRQAGFKANALGCWIVPTHRVEEVGKSMASFPEVTHCYERQTYTDWQYNLFTMIHGHTREKCETIARDMSSGMEIRDYVLLYSTREYKKERVQYFA